MFTVTVLALLSAMFLALVRAIAGPSLYDRVLAVNTFGTITVLVIAVLGFMTDQTDFVDIALTYALINFIGTIAVLKFVEVGDFGYQRSAQPPEQKN
ncbi:MAG: cation:proton antiporter [Gammaproteobacteria bacterium]